MSGRRILTAALLGALFVTLPCSAAPPQKVEPPSVDDLQRRLARAELLAGMIAVEGPGLILTLRDSAKKPPKGADRDALRVGEQDLNAVLNALRAAGAEALAVSGAAGEPERVVAGTAARAADEKRVRVNGTALAAPYRVLAVGNAAGLRAELFRAEGVVKRAALDALEMIHVEDAAVVRIPAARRAEDFRYARPRPNAAVPPAAAVPAVKSVRVAPPAAALASSEPKALAAVPAPARAADKVVQPEEKRFGGKDLERYHRVGCRFGGRIETGRRVWFGSAAEAQRAGRTPCPVCSSARAAGVNP